MVLEQQSNPMKYRAVSKSTSVTVQSTQHPSRVLSVLQDRSSMTRVVQVGKKLKKILAVTLQKGEWGCGICGKSFQENGEDHFSERLLMLYRI